MSDFILTEGDTVLFEPTFGPAVVAVRPGTLSATGRATLHGSKKYAVLGDEKQVAVPGCTYTTASQPVPGVGTLKIMALGADQQTQKMKLDGKPIIMKGSKFQAVFEVQAPAKTPPPANAPDPVPMHQGTGSFITQNTLFKAT